MSSLFAFRAPNITEVISYQSDVSKITPLSVTEVNEAEREIVKFVQKQTFKEE